MSHMSSRFLPEEAKVSRGDLVPLMVHPDDRDRLRALSGIWPVEDTLGRMIDVFIASTAPQVPASAEAETHKPAPQPRHEAGDFANNSNTGATARPARTAPQIATEPPSRKTVKRKPSPSLRTAAKADVKTETAPPKPPLMAFTREDYPDLKFTSLTGFSFGGASHQGGGLNWSSLFEQVVTQAIAAGYGVDDLERVGVRVREGRHTDKGFRWCEQLNRSVQVSTSNYMFTRILRIADLLEVPVRVGVSWDQAAGAAHPGRSALISAKPLRRPVSAPRNVPDAPSPAPTLSLVADPVEARFPTIGSMVSYVYLDRPDDEKLSYLVEGPADPEAGQVSVASPLGRALLETPTGSTASLDLKDSLRKVTVLDVLLS